MDINNIIEEGEEKIGGLINEIDESIPKKEFGVIFVGGDMSMNP